MDHQQVKKAAEGASEAIGKVVGLGFNALTDAAKGVATKIGEVASDIGKNLSKTAKSVVKAIEQVIPEVCPPLPKVKWTDIPSDIMGLLSGLGLATWLNYIMQELQKPNKYGKEYEKHHIVPQGAKKYEGVESKHKFFLDIARSVIT